MARGGGAEDGPPGPAGPATSADEAVDEPLTAGAADAAPAVTLAPGEAALSEEQARQLIETYESEAATRSLHGFWRLAAALLAGALSVYALYWTQYNVATHAYRAGFLMVALALSFMLYPVRGRRAWLEFALTLLCGAALFSLFWQDAQPAIRQRFFADLSQPLAAAVGIGILSVVALLALAGYLGRRREGWLRRLGAVPAYDVALGALAFVSLIFLILNYISALQRIINPTAMEVAMGILLITLVLEATRRTTGWILPAVAVGFLIYAVYGPYLPQPFDHRGYPIRRIVGQNFLTLEGIFGVPLDVAATFIILFTVYGAVLEYSGAGKFFLDWAFAALGKSRSGSGPGRAVTGAGFLLGTVSGSGVATTVTLGSLSWPMLRRAGYDRDTAGGILAAAGIGALLSPPTLGAAAFLIAEYLKMSYLQVLVMALIPTVLYYLSCVLMIEADSRRLGTRQVSVETPPLLELTLKYGYHFTSLFAVAVLMAVGMTPFMAVFWSIVIAYALSFLRPETRLSSLWAAGAGAALAVVLIAAGQSWSRAAFWGMMLTAGITTLVVALRALRVRVPLPPLPGLRAWQPEDERILPALESGGRGVLSVAATTAAAGLIVSVVTLTGLGLKVSGYIVQFSNGVPFLTVLYAAIAVWVLGLAVPVTASYIIAAVMVVPALKAVGVLEPAAHMFVFYYAVLADVSPPTALSPFAAAAITGGNPFRTMMLTWKYCLPAFLVPFMFTLNVEGASILLVGPRGVGAVDWGTVAWTFLTSCLAVAALAVALGGWFIGRAGLPERVLLGIGGLALFYASFTTDVAGLALLLVGLVVHLLMRRREAAARPAPAPAA